jgi:hypothetical protein
MMRQSRKGSFFLPGENIFGGTAIKQKVRYRTFIPVWQPDYARCARNAVGWLHPFGRNLTASPPRLRKS